MLNIQKSGVRYGPAGERARMVSVATLERVATMAGTDHILDARTIQDCSRPRLFPNSGCRLTTRHAALVGMNPPVRQSEMATIIVRIEREMMPGYTTLRGYQLTLSREAQGSWKVVAVEKILQT